MHLNTGGFFLKPGPRGPVQIWYYDARVYPQNLLLQLPLLAAKLNRPPTVVCG